MQAADALPVQSVPVVAAPVPYCFVMPSLDGISIPKPWQMGSYMHENSMFTCGHAILPDVKEGADT